MTQQSQTKSGFGVFAPDLVGCRIIALFCFPSLRQLNQIEAHEYTKVVDFSGPDPLTIGTFVCGYMQEILHLYHAEFID